MLFATACHTGPRREAAPVTHPSPGLSPEEIQGLPADLPSLAADEVRRRLAFGQPIAVIDVRGQDEYDDGHIPGSLHLPYYELQSRQAEVPRDKTVVLYCGGGDCPLSRWSTQKLREWGFTNVYELRGGIEDWRSRGYPTEASQPR